MTRRVGNISLRGRAASRHNPTFGATRSRSHLSKETTVCGVRCRVLLFSPLPDLHGHSRHALGRLSAKSEKFRFQSFLMLITIQPRCFDSSTQAISFCYLDSEEPYSSKVSNGLAAQGRKRFSVNFVSLPGSTST